MPIAPEAILQDHQGRSVLRFERTLAHPPERVWKALTDRTELGGWHPTPFEHEPEVGGTVRYVSGGDAPDAPEWPDGKVTEYDPPRVLAYTWGEDDLRWLLEPHDDGGCRLVLTHTFDDRFKAARDAAGWHVCLDALEASLGGDPDSRQVMSGPQKAWEPLNTAYEERFGIPHDQATPPPST